MSFFLFFPLILIFLDRFGYPFFWSILVSQAFSVSIALFLRGQVFWAVLYFILWLVALSIYEDARQMDVRYRFWFAFLAFCLPFVGIPLYFLLRNKFSAKIGKTIKTKEGTITFFKK
jgi:hypothetical protein